MGMYSIGLDFGTLSVRGLLIDAVSGDEISRAESEYAHGVLDVGIPIPGGKMLPYGYALQDPQDYLDGMRKVIRKILARSRISPSEIIGIGVDFTSSTVIPVKADRTPLCYLDDFSNDPHAYVKLWKHHGAEEEAQLIEDVLQDRDDSWFSFYGGKVSSEWMLPKVLETLNRSPAVYEAADYFMEALDWITWMLTGELVHSECGAGYKCFYRHDTGYPDSAFFNMIDPRLVDFTSKKLARKIKPVGAKAGKLCDTAAEMLGLIPGVPVAVGIIDAHASVLGAGISTPGTVMIILGTSSCHMCLSDTEMGIPGVGGLVYNGILPGYYGYEAGQCCVGDHFKWFIDHCVPEAYAAEAKQKNINIHDLLTSKLQGYRAGDSGLLALDWFNGVRTPLNDYNLNGMILGLNLQTRPEEIYLSLIEATAFGTRLILEQFEHAGIKINNIVLSGGIPSKNHLLVQVYSDICNRQIRVCGSDAASALGAAMLGISAAGEEKSGYHDVYEIVRKLGKPGEIVYSPNPQNTLVYDQLYQEYKTLADYFGKGGNNVMKRLNQLRRRF